MEKQIKEESLREEVIRNSIWSVLLSILTKFGGLIFTLILARSLMPEIFGAYSFILSIATIFMAIGDLGVNQALIILLSKHLKNEEKSRRYFKFLRNIKFFLLLSISIVFIISFYFISSSYLAGYNSFPIIIFCSLYIFFFSFTGVFSSIFYIHRRIKLDFIKELIFQIMRLFLITIILSLVEKKYQLITVFCVLAISSFIMFFYSYICSKRIASPLYYPDENKIEDKKRILKLLFYFMLGTLSLILFSEVDILMIGLLIKDLVYVGYYRAYFTIVIGVSGLLGFSSILLPIFSSFTKARLNIVFNKVSKYILLITMPACFGLLALGSYFIKLLYGDSYLPGMPLLYILVFLVISESLTNLFNTAISSRQRPKFIALSLLFSIILNVVLAYLLINILLSISVSLAVLGAAISTLISRYFFMLCLWIYSDKNFGLSFSAKDIIKPLLSSILMASLLYFISRSIEMNVFIGIVLVLIGAVFYFGVLFLLGGIKREDKFIIDIFSEKLKQVFHRKK